MLAPRALNTTKNPVNFCSTYLSPVPNWLYVYEVCILYSCFFCLTWDRDLIDSDVQLWIVRKDIKGRRWKSVADPPLWSGTNAAVCHYRAFRFHRLSFCNSHLMLKYFGWRGIIEIKVRLIAGWEGAVSRMIRKPEDLPMITWYCSDPRGLGYGQHWPGLKTESPDLWIQVRGFFLA